MSKPAHPAPATDERKSAIATVTSKRGRKPPAEPEDDAEADVRVKAFLARMVRPGGPLRLFLLLQSHYKRCAAARRARLGLCRLAGGQGRRVTGLPARSTDHRDLRTMPSAIVTTTYRYKRPPRKKKLVVLTGSAIVTPERKAHTPAAGPQASGSAIVRRVKAGNDNRSAERPSAIVTSKRGRKPPAEPEDDPEADARVKAFLARMVRPGGPLPPNSSE